MLRTAHEEENMDEELRMLREILDGQRVQRREIDEIKSSFDALVRDLEQEDRLRERLERAEAREREELAEAIDDLKKRVENNGTYLRDFPEKMLQHIEKKVYELRSARWEAIQAGVQRDPTPPFGTQLQGYREQTGKIAVPVPEPDDLVLTPGQQRGLVKLAKTAWRVGKWPALAATVSASVAGLWQHIVTWFKH